MTRKSESARAAAHPRQVSSAAPRLQTAKEEMLNENRYLSMIAMRRRLIVAGSVWPALALAATAHAQTKPPVVVGWLSLGAREPNNHLMQTFHEGMAALGWTAGPHYVLEARRGEGHRERMPALMRELVATKPAVIVASPGSSARMAAKAAPATPIVHFGSDALAIGLVKSLARPEGTITDVSNVNAEINAKVIELLVESMPKLRRIGFFADALGPSYGNFVKVVQRAAQRHHFEASIADVVKPEDIEPAITRLAKDKVQALVLLTASVLTGERQKIIKLSLAQRWALVTSSAGFAEAGALFSYGPDAVEPYRRAAYFVDRLLKGAKPGELPIEQPTTFNMVLNLKTAKALGITFPQAILVRASKVIE